MKESSVVLHRGCFGAIFHPTLMDAAPQLVSATFTALAAPHLFDVAVDAALELTRTYDVFRVHGPVCNVLVPGIMALLACAKL